MSTAYDYTQDGQPTTSPAPDFDPNDYSFIPLATAPDVEEIERDAESRQFKDLTPGDHLLFVKGFVGRPEVKLRTGYLRGTQVSWESAMVKVRLAKVGDPGASCVDVFDLPPADPRGQDAYLNSTKNAAGGNPGFMARKLSHFLSRLGFPCIEGAPLPAAACNLGNWVGRELHGTVELERQGPNNVQVNQQTGMPYPPRAQIKLFSYRAAESTVRGAAPAGRPLGAVEVVHDGRGVRVVPVAQPQPAGRTAAPSRIDAAGLNDL